MKPDDAWEELAAGLADLQVHDAPGERVDRIRARCAIALARRARRPSMVRAIAACCRRGEAAAALALSALYLLSAVGTYLALRR